MRLWYIGERRRDKDGIFEERRGGGMRILYIEERRGGEMRMVY